MMQPNSPAAAIAAAVEAFDAGNLAWGRFYHAQFRVQSPVAGAPAPAAVREALQEAALSVPPTPAAADVLAFASALATAFECVNAFLEAAPEPLRAGDVLLVPDALREALTYLAPLLAED